MAQGSSSGSSWSKKFEFQKSFIENKGQFIIPNYFGNPSDVLFAVDHGGTKIYFTKKGITYALLETTKKSKDARETERERRKEFRSPEEHIRHEKEEHELKVKADQVTMLWQNANPNVEIEGDGSTSDYHSYTIKQVNGEFKIVSNVHGFKKITYKNIYPNIDIDYVLSEKGGLKYSLTLHPGADASLVKMVYNSHVSLKSNGDIHIDTKFGNIVDHAPLTFYQQNAYSIITSAFIKTGNTISFQLSNYDHTKTVVIDPWTQTPAFATNWDCVWECERDGAGNVYIIGGVNPMQLLKYNSAGAIQWTYNTPYDTSAWLGTVATDNAGNSYVTNGSLAKITKVNAAGALVWANNSTGNSDEYWSMAFNCDQTKLIVGGTTGFFGSPPVLKGAIFDVDINTGVPTNTQTIAYGSVISFPPSLQEVRSIAHSNGKYYFLSQDSIGYVNCTPTPSIYKDKSTYSLDYKCENFRFDNSGIMAIKANGNFLYTQNGTHVHKRSLATGAILDTALIPGGASSMSVGKYRVENTGIDIDDCGNVYVGSKNALIKYDANLNLLGQSTTLYNVYDVQVTTNGDVIVCGSTGNSANPVRTGYIEVINMSACNTMTQNCCSITGINEQNQLANHVSVYPNPNNGEFNIDYSFLIEGQEIILIDMLGKEVKRFILENTKGLKSVNVSDLSNGIYSYKIQNKQDILLIGKISINK